ncbi:MAG: class I SAM-dependent methyltransferase [Terracidiphilus sp.]|jgi:ubiquinone/menaquinone biosynthesis C-methylase UbiE
MSEVIPVELAENLAAFRTPQAVDDLSFYRLFPQEQSLFSKYYKAGESVLDLACGAGRTTLLLHEMGMVVRGVDRSEVLIEVAKRRLPYLDLQIGSYDHIDEGDGSFSHVLVAFNGIDYAFPLAQRVKALRECARVLKPGGTFIYSSHNLKSLHWFSPAYRGRLLWKLRSSAKAFRDWAYVLEYDVHTFFASSQYAVRQTEDVGLKLLEVRGFNRFGSSSIDLYFSPYIHYVFEKPL